MQATLNAANTGTSALENAANSVTGVVADLDTMIIFATAGTLDTDNEKDDFSGTPFKTLFRLRSHKVNCYHLVND